MIELLVERIDVYADKICIKLRYSDTPIEPPTDFSDTAPNENIDDLSSDTSNNYETLYNTPQDIQSDAPSSHPQYKANPDRNNSCRGFLLFSFTKTHEISQTRTYKSGRTRTFTCSTTFIVEFYI